MTSVSGPGGREGGMQAFGRWLVRERELRGLDRERVARATKLAPGVVDALESGEEERMPPRVYVVGYLRAYAAAAGLDPDEVVLRFHEAAGPSRQGIAPRRAGSARIVLLLVAAIAAAAGGVWWLAR